jgi:tripartite-type tricarboxylate transporter receptor subunit TctC
MPSISIMKWVEQWALWDLSVPSTTWAMLHTKTPVGTHITNFKENKMKKLLTVLLATLSLSVSAQKETVTILYSWNAGDVAANFHRALANEANKLQNKYNFIFDVKPGAGGSVAASHILANPTQNLILANSSAFFIRPNFFPVAESHDLTKFKSMFPQCTAPIAVSSSKYKTWAEVPTDKPLSIGVSGLGVTTHLVATQVAKKYSNMIVVPFKSTTEASAATVGGQTDFAVNFIGDAKQFSEGKHKLYVLGITGPKTVDGIKPLAQQGFGKDLELMNTPAQLMVPVTVNDAKFKEWREIFLKAGRTQAVTDSYKIDFCENNNQMTDAEVVQYYKTQTENWKRLSQGISLK